MSSNFSGFTKSDKYTRHKENAMKNHSLRFILFAVLLVGVMQPLQTAQASATGQAADTSLSGWFTVIWGDSKQGDPAPTNFRLDSANGSSTLLQISNELAAPYGGVLALNGKYITVSGARTASAAGQTQAFQVTSLSVPQTRAATEAPLAVSGSQPWVTVMCKFSDISAEPKTLSYFQNMFSSTKPGLDHYWREVSYNTVNILGSSAVGWYTLPQPRSYYIPNGSLDFTRATNDCVAQANPDFNFANVVGINLMFNGELDGYSWGGTRYLTLDGVSKYWRVTWEPPWGYNDITVMSHEMGHGFGLPHSSGNYGQTYDNQWDVMSDTWSNCGNSSDAVYGCLGQHTISYYKYYLGWIPNAKVFTATNGSATITLERLALPQTTNYLMARIPIKGSTTHFYTVEARNKNGYDVKLPGQAVIIHDVDTTREIWAHVIDPDLNGNTGDAGAMWTAGETFSDATNGIKVKVVSETATGYQVTITTPAIKPGAFAHSSPANGATALSFSPTLKWSGSTGATSYQYCYDKTNDNACSTWISNGSATSVTLSGLSPSTFYYWQVRAVNSGGVTYANGSSTAFWSFKTRSSTVTTNFQSGGASDGWILESTETSNVGGIMNATDNALKLGDDAKNRQYKSVLSFNTSGLPDNAVIQSAVLKIAQNGLPIGTDPFSVLGSLSVDIRNGWFGSAATLELADFNTSASATKVANFGTTPASGWYSATLNATGRNNINKFSSNSGLTQFRLYFVTDDNNNLTADLAKFFSGNYATASLRPKLVIQYYTP